jgi:hypothetical protein
MTQEERIRAVIDCGFTERQARFLVLLMRHGGVCIPRQYASFAGIANGGRRCNAFFDRLVRRGYPYIDGYKPRFNFQALLEQVVLEYLDVHRDFFEPLVTGPVLNPTASPDAEAFEVSRVVEAPPEDMRIPQTVWSPSARISRFDFVARDAANRDRGRRGEEFVVEFERKRLHDGGRRDLVQRIEWTAQVRGDGAGYDVQSFNADGTSRLIEVKTTGLGKYFPFNVTVSEVRCSQARPDEFHLYRVFHFGPDARLYMLPGEHSKSCHLDATQYRAFVQGSGQRLSNG